MAIKLMTKTFDQTEVYENEIKPLLEQAFEKCKQHQIPFLCATCYRNDGGNDQHTIMASATFQGVERTPLNMFGAYKALLSTECAFAALNAAGAEGLAIFLAAMGAVDEPEPEVVH